MTTLTVDTITDVQIRGLLEDVTARLKAGGWPPSIGYEENARLTSEQHQCLVALGKKRARRGRSRAQARARCAEILLERCRGRTHSQHAQVTCNGSCCTECGGPIDENEDCRCDPECPTCLGAKRIRDGETKDLRRCLNCGGTGAIARPAYVQKVGSLCRMPKKPKTPKVGRPARAGKMADARFGIRLTGPELERWQAAADKQGLSLAELVRESVETCIARGSTR